MPTTTNQSDRRGTAFALPYAPLDATQAQLAEDVWVRFAPANAIDLLRAVPLIGELTTWQMSIVSASRGVNLAPFALAASITLDWSDNAWRAQGVTLTSRLLLTITTADATWRGVSGERGGDVTLRSKGEDGTIRVSLSRSTAIPAFAITGLSLYRWNADNLAYRGRTSPVPPDQLKRAVNTFVRKAAGELVTITQDMTSGVISIGEWQTRAAEHVQAVHTAVDIAGKGGWTQITIRDVERINRVREFQVEKLNDFADDVESGEITDGQVVSRAKLYDTNAGSATFEESITDLWAEFIASAGVQVEEINVLGEAEHCRTKGDVVGCLDLTERGWQPFRSMPRPGHRVCQSNCVCRMEYRRKRD